MELIFARIKFIAVFVLTGVSVAIMFHFYMGYVLGHTYPWNTFLFSPVESFQDWHSSLYAVSGMDPYFTTVPDIARRNPTFTHFASYFPFDYALFFLTGGASYYMATAMYLAVTIILWVIAILTYWQVSLEPVFTDGKKHHDYLAWLTVALIGSYPFMFGLDRGNIDCWIAPLEILFVVLLRTRFRDLGLIALSIAIAMKGYPAAFLLLAIADRYYVRAFFSVIMAITLNVFSLWLFKGGIAHNWQGFTGGLNAFHDAFVVGIVGINYSVDLYDSLRILGIWPLSNVTLLNMYHWLTLAFAGLASFFILFVDVARWRHVMAAGLIIMLFPDIANDYKLLSLFPGLLMLIMDKQKGKKVKIAFYCMGLLMIPKQYDYIRRHITISAVISPYLVLMLAWTTLADKKAWRTAVGRFPARLGWYVKGQECLPPIANSRANNG